MLTKYATVTIQVCSKMLIYLVLCLSFSEVHAQDFEFPGKRKKQSLQFKCIKNLIIIPMLVNGKGPYDFVLDTGVGPLIITEPSIIDSLNFAQMRKITLTGLGVENVEAFVSQNVNVQIGRAKIKYIPTAILKEDLFNLSGHLGVKIYGLIGFDFFNSFLVDIRYSENRLLFTSMETKIKYRGKKIPIFLEKQKPYVEAIVMLNDSSRIKTRLLMDTGASHALSMEMFDGGAFPLPAQKIKANLGMSISGQIKGYIGRVAQFYLGDYHFKEVVSGFPEYETISKKIDLTARNGNLGAEILRKFDVQLNYQEGFMYLKPNVNIKKPFQHDMVGMVVFLDQNEYKRVIVGEVDENSPAEKAGIRSQDEIIAIDFKPVSFYSLNDINEMFKSRPDRTIIFEIYRDDQVFFKIVRLEKRI
ncbi:aspartyl protease family protein [Pedobacter sandarakinus]|uniref:aspartyl protease family protein n=1 Tax=Pedobacter sandarakinus TaxID=353156 RepID=UPI00224663D7|nr:aspartyl protease family protein [Pedobacter sandarakinus]MCX2573803.1 aspartyl protease family protein [Pedobacter sandarakinus]